MLRIRSDLLKFDERRCALVETGKKTLVARLPPRFRAAAPEDHGRGTAAGFS
jgi:hypothetical protein